MKISIVGDVFVLTSSIKQKDFELIKRYNPESLRVVDDEGNDVFSVNYSAGNGSISKFGITFGGATRDDKAYLTVTKAIPAGVADAKAFVADEVGCAMANLKLLEDELPDIAKEIAEERKELIDSITVVS